MYFIHLLLIPPGKSPLAFARRVMRDEVEDSEQPELSPKQIDRLRDAATDAWPDLNPETIKDPGDYQVNLTVDDPSEDVTIEIFTLGALITIPGTGGPRMSADFWQKLFAVGQTLELNGELTGYDQVLDRIIDFKRDMESVRQSCEKALIAETAGANAILGKMGPFVLLLLVAFILVSTWLLYSHKLTVGKFLTTWLPTALFIGFGYYIAVRVYKVEPD